MEVHHVDLKSAGGAAHAGNLILLCTFHHHNYGRRLTRNEVTNALRSKPKKKMIKFCIDSDEGLIHGKTVSIELADTGEFVEIFFTDQHADFWLNPLSSY